MPAERGAGLRVALGTIGRFHFFDLARELARHGCLAAIHTGYPKSRLRDTGVPPSLIRSFPWVQAPVMGLQRAGLLPAGLYGALDALSHRTLARRIARTLPECHVLSVMSATGLEAGRAAQARNIAYVCDRGSTHALWRERLLSEEHARLDLPFHPTHPALLAREQAEYETADAIMLGSGFARRSFIEMGVPAEKLHVIPYGVALRDFRRVAPRDATFRALFVGQLSARKGLGYLLEGFARARIPGATLALVGDAQPETEALLARHPAAGVERLGPLPRDGVVNEMSRASVLVLPSVEDGFGLVLAQAMACGCPVIASTHTGVADIVDDGVEGCIVPVRDADAIADRLVRLAGDGALVETMAEAGRARVGRLGGWDSYGRAAVVLFGALARARGYAVAEPT